jgi:hypothetical protein
LIMLHRTFSKERFFIFKTFPVPNRPHPAIREPKKRNNSIDFDQPYMA